MTNSKAADDDRCELDRALHDIGEPLTDADLAGLTPAEDCSCKDGMFPLTTRRRLLAGVGMAAAAGAALVARGARAAAPPGAVEDPVPEGSTKEPAPLPRPRRRAP